MTPELWPKHDKKVREVLPEKLGGDVRHASWNPYPISDQNLWFSLPYFRPEALEPGAWPERVTSCYGTYTVVGVNIKREIILSPNDEEVANSSKKHYAIQDYSAQTIPYFRPKWSRLIPYFRPKRLKSHIAYIRDYPPRQKPRCRLWVSMLTQASLKRPLASKSYFV